MGEKRWFWMFYSHEEKPFHRGWVVLGGTRGEGFKSLEDCLKDKGESAGIVVEEVM